MFDSQKIASTYDQIGLNFSATRTKLSLEVISLLPKLPENAKVLDLGCGNGVLITSLPKDTDYTGIDISSTLINEAHKLHPKNNFILADITKPETWKALTQYDFITALAIFHHLPNDTYYKLVLQNIKQHLKKTGSVLISVWRLDQPRFDRFRLDARHLSIPFHNGPKRDFYVLTEKELVSLCRQTSFAQIKITKTKNNLYLLLN